MIRLASPALLFVGILLFLPYLLRPQQAWHYSSLKLLPAGKKTELPFLLTAGVTCSALTLLLIALARPQGTVERSRQVLEVRDMLLTIDLSHSMEGQIASEGKGIRIQKLDLVQHASLEFVQRHPHDRLGLIVFGDEAFGVWPLSTDSTTLQQRLQHLDTLLPRELRGTHIEKALRRSLEHFQELGQAQTKLLLLLTDGLDTIDSAAEEHILQQLRRNQVTLYVLGIQLREDASIVELTRRAQGRYFNIQQGEDLEKALQEIDRLETSPVEVVRAMERKELYPVFAFSSLVLLLVSTILKHTWVLEL
jgi:Ca-activated chloride channel family protein